MKIKNEVVEEMKGVVFQFGSWDAGIQKFVLEWETVLAK